jgi:glucose-6-phosphate 1-dehydrogenase
MAMAQAQMAFDYATRFGVQSTPAYSRLLIDALAGDRTLFLRGDEIEASWRFADRVRELWDGEGAPPLLEYQAGTWGPDVAHALFQGCEGGWSRG